MKTLLFMLCFLGGIKALGDSGWTQNCKLASYRGNQYAGISKDFSVSSSCLQHTPQISYCKASILELGAAKSTDAISIENSYGLIGEASFMISDPVTFRPGPALGMILTIKDKSGRMLARSSSHGSATTSENGIAAEYFTFDASEGYRFIITCRTQIQ